MQNPNYILKTNETITVKNEPSKKVKGVKIAVIAIILVIILASLVFQDNIFAELSGTARFLLVAIAIGVLFVGGKSEDITSPMEIWFYDDHLVLYRYNRYYSPKKRRTEYNTMYYNWISKCVYDKSMNRIKFYGDVHAVWYDFDKNGVQSASPTYNREVKDTLLYFRTRLAPETDFVKEIETHSPIKVEISE